MGVSIEKVLVNVPITGSFCDEARRQNFTLIRVLFSNNWSHRIEMWIHQMRMIDTEGIQHEHEIDDLHIYQEETEVIISKKRKVSYDFTPPSTKLEGKAKTRGWLWFPALPQEIYPHRLIFNFDIFAPGCTSGGVEDRETLEVAFDFQFKQLLAETKSLITLEIEDI